MSMFGIALAQAGAQGMMGGQGTMGMMDGGMGMMMGLVMLFWLVVPVAIVFLLWLAYRIAKGKGWLGDGSGAGEAERILRERYARGDIDRDAYMRALEDLRGPSGGGG